MCVYIYIYQSKHIYKSWSNDLGMGLILREDNVSEVELRKPKLTSARCYPCIITKITTLNNYLSNIFNEDQKHKCHLYTRHMHDLPIHKLNKLGIKITCLCLKNFLKV